MYARSLWGEGWGGGWGRRKKKERERERREGGGCKGGFEKLLFSSGSFFSFFFFPHSFRFFILLVLSLRLLSLLSPFSPREHAARALTHEQADSGCSGSSGSGSLRSLVRSVSRSFCLARAPPPAGGKERFALAAFFPSSFSERSGLPFLEQTSRVVSNGGTDTAIAENRARERRLPCFGSWRWSPFSLLFCSSPFRPSNPSSENK